MVNFVVLDLKEDEELPIFLGRQFLSIARALVDIYDSKLTVRVEDDAITFEMLAKVNYEERNDEESKIHAMEEDLGELTALKKMMEEEPKVWKQPNVEKVKRLEPKSQIPMIFVRIAFNTPKVQEEEEVYDIKEELYEEVEIIEGEIDGELKETIMVELEVEKEGSREDVKKANMTKKKGKGVKRKHEDNANKKKKDNSKKDYKRRV